MSDIIQPQETEHQKIGRRETNRADNREAILSAGRAVFSELGFGATTIRDIVRHTDLASGTFYNYFDSKEAVFEALMKDMGERLRLELKKNRVLDDSTENAVENMFKNSFYAYFSFFVKNRADYTLVRSNRGREGGHMSGPQVRAGFEEMRADIQAGIRTNHLPEIDPAYLAAACQGIAFALLDIVMKDETPDAHHAAAFVSDLLLGGLQRLAR